MDLARACLPFMEMGTACFPISVIQTLRLRASVHDLCVIPMAFESQGVLHENWEEIYHLFVRHWVQTHRADVDESQRKREASALVRMWTAHTSLTIQRAQCNKMVPAVVVHNRRIKTAKHSHKSGPRPHPSHITII